MEAGNNSAELFVSYDRNNITVRLYSDNIYDYYKDCRSENKQFYNCDFIEMPNGTVTPDGYFYSIRGKKSLKEFICGEESLDIKMFKNLVDELVAVIDRATQMNIQITDLVFDYNCVFLQPSERGYSFVYMPGASLSINAPTMVDLVSVVFFNIDMDSIEEEYYDRLKGMVSEIQPLRLPHEISEKLKALSNEIEAYIELNQSFAEKIRKKLMGKPSVKQGKKPDFDRKAVFVKDNKVVFEKLIKIGEEDKIKIGRDDSWADYKLENAFSSRRHAEILISKEGLVSIIDYSLNGTFVDGEPAYESNSFETGEDGLKLKIGRNIEFVLKIERISA